jgi:replicative DNA helicase
MATDRLPPHNVEAEEAVIGSLLIDNESIFRVSASLKVDDFFIDKNRDIYEACLALYQRNDAINQITVAHELARNQRLDQVGGAAYLSHLIAVVPTSVHAEFYAGIVSNLSIMRQLIMVGTQIVGLGYEAKPDAEESLSKADDILFKIRQRQGTRGLVPLRQALDKYFEEMTPIEEEAEEIPHVLTGFNALDQFLGGLQRSDLIIVAARPSVGKTSLALNIARNSAVKQKACVALFSLEMSREAVVQRFLSSESGVDGKKVRLGIYNEDEERRIMDASGVLSEAPIYIDDSPQVRTAEMRSKARRLHMERGLDLVIVDYLQLMQGEKRSENRVQEVSDITRSLKALARDLNVPVIAVSQLSRQVEWRASHRPQLSDLRESGSIEQDADLVIFIYRAEREFTEEEWYKEHTMDNEVYPKGIADIIVAKHRNGPTDTVKLRYISRLAKFDDVGVGVRSSED